MAISNNEKYLISEEEYLKGELISHTKHELVDGQVYAMTGASRNHNLIAGNFFRELSSRLIKKSSTCKTFMADMKVKVNQNFFYPDVLVVCEESTYNDYFTENPVLIIEVLSNSTRKNDTSLKRLSYFNIPGLKEYVLVEQEFCQVQVFRRNNHWQADYYFLGDEILFESINVRILVEDIYFQIESDEILKYLREKK